MNITVNESVVVIDEQSSLEQLLISLDKPLKGSALAVNKRLSAARNGLNINFVKGMKSPFFRQ